MRFRQELADPWGWLVAGVSGGVGWAALAGSAPTGVPVVVGALIGLGVRTTSLVLGAIRPRPRTSTSALPTLPRPTPGGVAASLLVRAQRAGSRISELVGSTGDPWLRDQMAQVDAEADRVRRSLDEVARRVTLLEQSLDHSEPHRLADEVARLTIAFDQATDEQLRTETETTLAAVAQQRDVLRRLEERRDTLIRRMETTVIGMEGLAARMGEIVAVGASSLAHDETTGRVGALTDDLEALSAGLEEARHLG